MPEATGNEHPGNSPNMLTPEQQFQAALARFQDHVELLRSLTGIDLQIVGGVLTLQLGLAAWLVEHPPTGEVGKIGLFVLSATLTAVAGWLLYTSFTRRKEVVESLARTKRYFRFSEAGAYIHGEALDAPMNAGDWFPWFLVACVVALLAVAGIIFFGGL